MNQKIAYHIYEREIRFAMRIVRRWFSSTEVKIDADIELGNGVFDYSSLESLLFSPLSRFQLKSNRLSFIPNSGCR
jgi:hypothetical protein